MFGSRFLWKIYAGHCLIILMITATVGYFLARYAEREALEEIETNLRQTALLVREIAPTGTGRAYLDPFQERIRGLGAETGARITLILPDGTVIADSHEDPLRMENRGARPEILDAQNRGAGTATRFSGITGRMTMYHAVPVVREGEIVGFVRASLSLASVEGETSRLRTAILGSAALAMFTGLLLAFAFAHRVMGPLKSMTAAAHAVAGGEYGRRIPINRSDEVGDLGRSFNRMAGQLEEQLRKSSHERDQLLTILHGMVEGVIAVDENEKIRYMNNAAGRILQVPVEESRGKALLEATRRYGVSEVVRRATERTREERSEIRIPHEGGDQWIEMRAAPLEKRGVVLVLHDVSHLRRLESVRRDFVANVSHELKTPITAIRGLVETILDDREMTADTREKFIRRIGGQSSRLASLVADLLELSRLESTDAGSRRDPVDVREPVREAAAERTAEGERRGIPLTLDLPPRPVMVHGSARELRQVADNLIANALRYTPGGGRVSVRLREEGDRAVLEVEDTGVGIDPVHRERVFERFYRVDKGRSREIGGTGLGLSIVKHIVLSHGGVVDLESETGRGSTFTVRLPLRGTPTPSDS